MAVQPCMEWIPIKKEKNVCTLYICCKMNIFFNVFINHFPKIQRSAKWNNKWKWNNNRSIAFLRCSDMKLCEKNFTLCTAYSCITNVLNELTWITGCWENKDEISLWACKFFKMRLQNRCFPVEFVKLSRTMVDASENTKHIMQ